MNTREYLISKGHSPEAIVCNDWDKLDSEFDLEEMLEDYHQTKLNNEGLGDVSKSYSVQQMDDAYDKGHSDGLDNRAC